MEAHYFPQQHGERYQSCSCEDALDLVASRRKEEKDPDQFGLARSKRLLIEQYRLNCPKTIPAVISLNNGGCLKRLKRAPAAASTITI